MIFSLVHCCFSYCPSFCLCQSVECSARIYLCLDCDHRITTLLLLQCVSLLLSLFLNLLRQHLHRLDLTCQLSQCTHIMFCGISSLNERLPRLSPIPFFRQNKSSSWNSRSSLSEQLKQTWVLHLLLPQPFFHQCVYEGRREAGVYVPPWAM